MIHHNSSFAEVKAYLQELDMIPEGMKNWCSLHGIVQKWLESQNFTSVEEINQYMEAHGLAIIDSYDFRIRQPLDSVVSHLIRLPFGEFVFMS